MAFKHVRRESGGEWWYNCVALDKEIVCLVVGGMYRPVSNNERFRYHGEQSDEHTVRWVENQTRSATPRSPIAGVRHVGADKSAKPADDPEGQLMRKPSCYSECGLECDKDVRTADQALGTRTIKGKRMAPESKWPRREPSTKAPCRSSCRSCVRYTEAVTAGNTSAFRFNKRGQRHILERKKFKAETADEDDSLGERGCGGECFEHGV